MRANELIGKPFREMTNKEKSRYFRWCGRVCGHWQYPVYEEEDLDYYKDKYGTGYLLYDKIYSRVVGYYAYPGDGRAAMNNAETFDGFLDETYDEFDGTYNNCYIDQRKRYDLYWFG